MKYRNCNFCMLSKNTIWKPTPNDEFKFQTIQQTPVDGKLTMISWNLSLMLCSPIFDVTHGLKRYEGFCDDDTQSKRGWMGVKMIKICVTSFMDDPRENDLPNCIVFLQSLSWSNAKKQTFVVFILFQLQNW